MLKKIVTALLSIIIFGLLMGVINYLSLAEKDFTAFWLPILFFGMYSAPVYFIGGIPLSYLIDKLIGQKSFQSVITLYFAKFALYSVAGIVTAFVYVMIFAIAENELYLILYVLINYLILGMIASLIYYHISLFLYGNKES